MTVGNFEIININDVIGNVEQTEVLNDIAAFCSKNNDDVENFLKKNAINFCRLKQGVTYLVYNQNRELTGYFTFALKIMEFPLSNLSKATLRILERLGQKDDDKIKVPGILLAQWSKNFNIPEMIHGIEFMDLVETIFELIQYYVGGSFCFLECESDKTGLLRKYEEYGYKPVSSRLSKENKPLVQFIKKI